MLKSMTGKIISPLVAKGSDMDATLRFLTFLLLVPSILNSIQFWLRVFEVTIK